MTLVRTMSGCKVGWLVYDNKAEAEAAAVKAREDAARMAAQGYDFGYQWPGAIDRTPDGMWRVVIP